MFEIRKPGDKTSSGEIGLDIRTHASPKVGQDQVSGGVIVLCWYAAPVAVSSWKPIFSNVNFSRVKSRKGSQIAGDKSRKKLIKLMLEMYKNYPWFFS